MFNKFTIPLCAVAMAAAMAPMTADAMRITYNKPAAGGFESVNTDRSAVGGPNKSVLAGPFDMSQSEPADPLGDFIAWCFEIDAPLVTSATGTLSYSFGGALDTNQRARVQSVFDANYNDSEIETNKTKGAAFQLAIWEAIYETTDTTLSLNSGAFVSSDYSTVSGTLGAIAEGYLKAANGFNGKREWVITELKSGTKQDLGTVNAIPLPAAAWLLLGVSGALVGAKRRSARKAA